MASTASIEEAVSCILPCFWVYSEVGKKMLRMAEINNNPYADWIELYASSRFENSVNLAIDITNELGVHASSATEKNMLSAFQRATQLEWLFWDGAYKLETWDISYFTEPRPSE